MKNRISICMQILIGCFFVMGSSLAADFTFNVPVSLYGQPEQFNEGKVMCVVGTNSGSLIIDPESEQLPGGAIGKAKQAFNINSQGVFQGTLTLIVNAASTAAAITVSSWRCEAFVKDDQTGHFTFPEKNNQVGSQPTFVSGSIDNSGY